MVNEVGDHGLGFLRGAHGRHETHQRAVAGPPQQPVAQQTILERYPTRGGLTMGGIPVDNQALLFFALEPELVRLQGAAGGGQAQAILTA